jgi:hypothetical protein
MAHFMKMIDISGDTVLRRRELLKGGMALAGTFNMSVGLNAIGAAVVPPANPGSPPAPTPAAAGPRQADLDAGSEAKKIAFDRIGNGEKVLLISGFPQTRLS